MTARTALGRPLRWLGVLAAMLALPGCASHRSAALGPAALQRARESVVLVIRHNADGSVGYGAGVVVNDTGRLLTNLHVVAPSDRITVMQYKPGRTSYTPEDGGLARFLYEYQDQLVAAHLVLADPIQDLALIQADEPMPAGRPIRWRRDPRVAEQVVALGHPQEAVWAVSVGHIGALHQGSIQHDAAVNRGNSGGPLLDRRGRAVGVNTLKLLGGTDGIGFARPTEAALGLLGATSAEADRRSPTTAFLSCQRLAQTGSNGAVSCIDWGGLAQAYIAAISAKSVQDGSLAESEKLAFEAELRRHPGLSRQGLEQGLRRSLTTERRTQSLLLLSAWGGWYLSKPPTIDSQVVLRPDLEQPAGTETDPALTLRMALKIQDTADIDDDRVWLLVTGRDLRGQSTRFAQLMVRSQDGWMVGLAPTAQDAQALPPEWPGPMQTVEELTAALLQQIGVQP